MDIGFTFIFALLLRIIHASWVSEITIDRRNKQEFVLDCSGNGRYFVSWYRENNRGSDDRIEFSAGRYEIPAGTKLKILGLRLSDSGVYKCKDLRQNVIGSFSIRVYDSGSIAGVADIIARTRAPPAKVIASPPVWSMYPRPYTTIYNTRTAVLRCRARGDNVVVKAFRIYPNGREKQYRNADIVLKKPKGSDSGRYKCTAKNEGGTKVHYFQLVVKVNGGWSAWSAWSRCNAKCGQGIKNRHRLCTDPKPENGGLRCYGYRSQRERCNSRTPCVSPRLVKFGYDMSGPNLILYCKAKGTPTPSVEWKLDGMRLDASYKPRTTRTVIPKRNAQNGYYACTIRNSAGYYSMSMQIEVQQDDE